MAIVGAVKRSVHSFLDRTKLYERLEWSPPHRVFVRFNNRTYEASQRADRLFYSQFVSRNALVMDIGANIGSKAETLSRLGARVIAVEPDPQCAAILRRRFMLHRGVHVVSAAVGAAPSKATLFCEKAASAYNTLSQKWREAAHLGCSQLVDVEVTTLDALIAEWGIPSFIKIDVEGCERDVLAGLSVPPAVISFEANLPLFRDETISCIQRLCDLSPRYMFNACFSPLGSDCWHWPYPVESAAAIDLVKTQNATVCYELFAISVTSPSSARLHRP